MSRKPAQAMANETCEVESKASQALLHNGTAIEVVRIKVRAKGKAEGTKVLEEEPSQPQADERQ
jgi:hypothetical protein